MAGSNGPARGQNGPKGGKASTQLDVENYFNINEVQQLVNRAVNSVAEERPADFKKGLSAAITAHAMSGLAPEAAKKRHTKKDAEEAKKYLDKNNAEAILSEMLGKLAVTMPANASQSLAEYAMTATGADAYVAPKPDKPPKEEKKEEKKEGTAEKKEKKKKEKKDEPAAAPAQSESAAADAPAAKETPVAAPASTMDPKKLKAAVKEGGKMGVELIGNFDLGGPEFFTTKAEAPEGDHELLQALMDAANKEVDPTEEEAKGGSAKVGKMFLSAGPDRLALNCWVPKEDKAAGKTTAKEWMQGVLSKFPDGSWKMIQGDDFVAVGELAASKDAGRFPLKDRDDCQSYSVGWLKEKGLFPEKEEDEDWQPDDDAGIEW